MPPTRVSNQSLVFTVRRVFKKERPRVQRRAKTRAIQSGPSLQRQQGSTSSRATGCPSDRRDQLRRESKPDRTRYTSPFRVVC